ncbi:MAG: glutaredoxin family protein [Deltaproteobacteria bacterium]|nr:glutaredoxin family protein [Deltaproteobacteria bacterium]
MNRRVHLFTLSTCGWCRKTKRFLDEHGVDYTWDDVDLLPVPRREEIEELMARHNPRVSYPTIVVDGSEVIVGFDEARLRAALHL